MSNRIAALLAALSPGDSLRSLIESNGHAWAESKIDWLEARAGMSTTARRRDRRPVSRGIGSIIHVILKRWMRRMGWKCGRCGCKGNARKINEWGPVVALNRIDDIWEMTKESARECNLPEPKRFVIDHVVRKAARIARRHKNRRRLQSV